MVVLCRRFFYNITDLFNPLIKRGNISGRDDPTSLYQISASPQSGRDVNCYSGRRLNHIYGGRRDPLMRAFVGGPQVEKLNYSSDTHPFSDILCPKHRSLFFHKSIYYLPKIAQSAFVLLLQYLPTNKLDCGGHSSSFFGGHAKQWLYNTNVYFI